MMTKENLRIVFMGTPEFAVESLKALRENGYNIVGVITMPDKPAGRGYKLQHSPVKAYAVSQGLHVLQPEKLKDEQFLEELKSLNAHLQIVVAFRMLPQAVWEMPEKGTFNLHTSLLPQYRGSAPINRAIMNGEKETGVTTFFLSHEIDTGNIIFQEKTIISENDNAESLHNRLMKMGASLVLKTVDTIIAGNVETKPQQDFIANGEELKTAPKIFKETCKISWNKSAKETFDFIRALSPYPAAWTTLQPGNNVTVKIFSGEKIEKEHKLAPGTIVTDNKSFLDVAVKNGFIRIADLQLSGKKRMNIKDFLNGFKFDESMVFV